MVEVDNQDIPRIAQCFTCKKWRVGEKLIPVMVPDQGNGWIEKKICKSCLDCIRKDDR